MITTVTKMPLATISMAVMNVSAIPDTLPMAVTLKDPLVAEMSTSALNLLRILMDKVFLFISAMMTVSVQIALGLTAVHVTLVSTMLTTTDVNVKILTSANLLQTM